MDCPGLAYWYCVCTVVLGTAVGILVLLSIAAIACICCLCRKAYRFRCMRCSCKLIHCLCCSCEIKDIQPEDGPVEPPPAGDLARGTGTSGQYEIVVAHTEAPGSLGNRRPEPLPRPPSHIHSPLPTQTGDTEDDVEDGSKPRTISVDYNYIEFVEPDTRTDVASNAMPPSPLVRESSTLKKRVTKEEVQPFGYKRLSAPSEDDEVPLLGDTANKGGYQSTHEYLQCQPAMTRPISTGSNLAHKHASALHQREAHGHGAGHLSPLPSSDAATSDDGRSSNPAAVHGFSPSSPA